MKTMSEHRTFYATTSGAYVHPELGMMQGGSGRHVHAFKSRKSRATFLTHNSGFELTAREAGRYFKSKGIYTRYGYLEK